MDVDDETATKMADLIGITTEKEVQRATKGITQRLDETTQKEQLKEKVSQTAAAVRNNVQQAATIAMENGGIEAKIIDDLNARGSESVLAKRLKANPEASLSVAGVRGLISDISMEAFRTAGVRPNQVVESTMEDTAMVSSVGSNAVSTKAVPNRLNQDAANKLTPEQAIQAGILNARKANKKLPDFMLG